MPSKIIKKTVRFITDTAKAIQVSLVFTCLFIGLYWLLQVTNVPIIQPVAPFFETLKIFADPFPHIYIDPTGTSFDFSFLIVIIMIGACIGGLHGVIDFLEYLESRSDLASKRIRKIHEDVFNRQLERDYLKQEYKNDKILVMITFKALKMREKGAIGEKPTECDAKKEKEVLFDFIEILDEDLKSSKRIVDNKILIMDSFNNTEEIISVLSRILNDMKNKYREDRVQLELGMSVDAYSNSSEIEKKEEKLACLNNLGLNNEILCFLSFKHRYSLIKNPKFNIYGKGFYSIQNAQEDVFYIKT